MYTGALAPPWPRLQWASQTGFSLQGINVQHAMGVERAHTQGGEARVEQADNKNNIRAAIFVFLSKLNVYFRGPRRFG